MFVLKYNFDSFECNSITRYDKFGILEGLSRLLRVSICVFWGRWGLPIPYRVPILGVLGEFVAIMTDLA